MNQINERNFENPETVWEPGPESGKYLKQFKKIIEDKYNVRLADYWDVHKWSLEHLAEFWAEMWDFIGIIHSRPCDQVIDLNIPMEDCPEWFSGARLNFAENLLRYKDDHVAIIAAGEEKETKRITYAQMHEETRLYAAALKNCGLKIKDRVICYMGNREEPVFAMLAVTSIGAIWTGALPLLGYQAVLNRFQQVQPKVMFTIDRYLHDKEEHDMLHKVEHIAAGLPSLQKVVIVPSTNESKSKDISHIKNSCWLDEFLGLGRESDGSVPILKFEQLPVSHPLFISYTSGTTGLPKAIVHGSGILLSMAMDFLIQNESERENIWLSISPVGWASWNIFSWMLFLGVTVVLFEGVPYFLTPTHFWDMVDELKITNLFFPASILDQLEKREYFPTQKHKLTSLNTILSGGCVAKPQTYDFIYKKVKPDVIFSEIYGATEIMGGCVFSDRTLKIHKGEIPCPSLGMDVQVVDEAGKQIYGELGEVVIGKPSPAFPLGFWGNASLFKKSYFEKFPGKFCMGDYATINPVTKGFIICGRSDDTLKAGGCRFGSSEIYNIVETFQEIRDSVCVSQFDKDFNERAVLFVKMREGNCLNDALIRNIRASITRELSSRHVPAVILEILDIPYNLNGKKMEIIVKKIINNMPFNSETVINPECLKYFYNIPELQGY